MQPEKSEPQLDKEKPENPRSAHNGTISKGGSLSIIGSTFGGSTIWTSHENLELDALVCKMWYAISLAHHFGVSIVGNRAKSVLLWVKMHIL